MSGLEERLATLEQQLAVLEAKQEIHETLMRYCRGVDRADAELISSAFHPDATADHGLLTFNGAEIGDALTKIENVVQTGMHFVGNELIDVIGDVAFCEAYFISFSEVERDGQPFLIARGARYVDRWERRDGGAWKIAYRVVPGQWNRVDPIVERIPNADRLHRSYHSHEDAVYQIREDGWRLRPHGAEDESPAATFLQSMSSAGFASEEEQTQ
jgi:ketosteroid isomerase-like protein